MNVDTLIKQSEPFLSYIVDWLDGLSSLSISDIVSDGPDNVAVISVDIINGFCYEGPLASPRVASLVEPIVDVFNLSYEAGIRNLILTQDAHDPNSVEFEHYPPHCVRGTSESETVDAFKALPYFDLFQVMPKQSLHSGLGTDLNQWVVDHPDVDTFITLGDCTDLCTYQLAMHLKLSAIAANKKVRVILPVDCVDTYDLPVSVAQEIGAIPHDGDLLHQIFLYSMMLNGVEVISQISK
ncbi:MAG: isochorismatase family protein [Chloroflexota bacterium]